MSGSRPRARALLIVVLHLALAAVLALHVAWAALRPYGRSDFSTFYLSADEVRRGGSPYTTRLAEPYLLSERDRGEAGFDEVEEPTVVSNLNPPFQTVVTVPLAFLPYRAAEWTWYVLGLVAGVSAAFLIARTWLPERPLRIWGPAAALVVLLYVPTLGNALYNQVGLFLLLTVAMVFWLAERGRLGRAAAVAGLMAGLKVFAGLFGVYFLSTRRWRLLLAFGVALAASVLVGGITLGWEAYPRYLSALGRVDWHATSWNASVFGGVTRWLGSSGNAGAVAHRPGFGYPAALTLAAAAGVGYALLLAARGAGRDRAVVRLGIGLTCTMMILLSPLGWLYYFPALLPAAAALIASTRGGRERALGAGVVVAFLVLSSGWQRLHRPEELGADGYRAWMSDLPLLALVVLAAGQGWLLVRRSSEARGAPSAQPADSTDDATAVPVQLMVTPPR